MIRSKAHSTTGGSAASRLLALTVLVTLSACSNGDSGTLDPGTASSVVQNLSLDPDGFTVVADLEGITGPIPFGSIIASGGQQEVFHYFDGTDVIVEFDARVAPGDRIRFDGVSGVDGGWRDVTTTDPRQPQMGIVTAVQDTTDNVLGGDQIIVAFVGGARVIESQAEELANWTLTVEGVELDLAGTVISMDPGSQVAGITLGPLANLHSTFRLSADLQTVAATALSTAPVNGTAAGDNVAPALEGGSPVVQNLDTLTGGDPYGRVLEFDFDEPISPVFGATASNFGVVDHVNAVGTTTISRVAVDMNDNTLLRVVFSRPVVPGLDQIDLQGIVDAHGNPLGAITVPVASQGGVVNSFSTVEFVTQEGLANDYVTATTIQALDPDTAARSDRWTLEVDGTPVMLAGQALSYDLVSRTLLIQLDFDAPNGTTADLTSVGAVDIDGDDFSVAAAQVLATGDVQAPSVVDAFQNRSSDPSGRSIDVRFSEEVDVVTASNPANYSFMPAIAVNSATLMDGVTVRLDLASVAVPGDVLITVAQAIEDPAGNDLGGNFGPAPMTSTDTTSPAALGATLRAVEGPSNDNIGVLFSDDMIQGEVETITSWALESPVGSPVDLTGAVVAYDALTRIASITLDGGAAPSFLLDRDFDLSFTSMRDIAGNQITPSPVGGVVTGERNLPALEAAFIVAGGSGNEIVLRFSEAMGRLTDLYDAALNPEGVRFGVTDPMTSTVSYPSLSVALDGGLGVQLTYGSAVDPLATVDVFGLTDLAGNALFPVFDQPLDVEDPSAPVAFAAPTVLAVSGVGNDSVSIQFNVPMASWRLLDPASYSLEVTAGAPVDMTGATFEFDGNDTVTVTLADAASGDLSAASNYDVELLVNGANPLRSRQGVELAVSDLSAGIAVSGDVISGPTQAGSLAMLDPSDANSIVVVFEETVDAALALNPLGYDYNSGSVATGVVALTERAVRATFSAPVAAGVTLEIQGSVAVDTAGNQAPGTLSLVVIDDQSAPTIVSTAADIQAGFGGDIVTVRFDEELDPAAASMIANYTVSGAAGALRIGAARYVSNLAQVQLYVEDMVEGEAISVSVQGIQDLAGNAPGAALTDAAVAAGDAVVPTIESMFVDRFFDPSGRTIEVLFSEPIDTQFARLPANWSTSSFVLVQEIEVLGSDHVRLFLSGALGVADTVTLAAGLEDAAGNVQASLTVDPAE